MSVAAWVAATLIAGGLAAFAAGYAVARSRRRAANARGGRIAAAGFLAFLVGVGLAVASVGFAGAH